MKMLLQYLLLVTIPAWICLELLGLFSVWAEPRLYASPSLERAIHAIDEARFARFGATVGSKTLGWDQVPNRVGPNEDCEGGQHVASIDHAGARIFRGYDASAVRAILIGDSYTHGDEVGDDDTIAAHLLRQSGIMAANLGVGGYSPLQAVLRAKERRGDYPRAEAIVLGIMYENLRRNVNAYVPTLGFLDDEQSVFALRPHLQGEVMHPLPAAIFADPTAFKAAALHANAVDFWARPPATFPYSLSMIRALVSNSGSRRIMASGYKLVGRQFAADFGDKRLAVPLFVVLRDFFLWAADNGITPVVVFSPQNRHDSTSATIWTGEFAHRLPANGVIAHAALDGIDWNRFTRRHDLVCHPSSYGYAALAASYAVALKPVVHPGQDRY